MTDRFLITGSSGFLGAAVAAKLCAAGHCVVGIDPAPPADGAAHQHVADDLSDPVRLAGIVEAAKPDRVIHAGGVSGPMVPVPPAEIMAINVAGSINLLQASVAAGVKRFVFCSSISAVGAFTGGPLPDDAPLQPNTPYGASKAAMEQVLRGLVGLIPIELCALRLTAVYGPGRRTANSFHEMIVSARAQRPLPVPAAANSWPYVFIDDAADAVIAAALSPGLSQLSYNVAHPDVVSLQDIADALGEAGCMVQLVPDPALPVVARGTLAVAAAQRDFGFSAAVDHREGVRRVLEAFIGALPRTPPEDSRPLAT
jgi:UDP-glucuronate 4-epimerase